MNRPGAGFSWQEHSASVILLNIARARGSIQEPLAGGSGHPDCQPGSDEPEPSKGGAGPEAGCVQAGGPAGSPTALQTQRPPTGKAATATEDDEGLDVDLFRKAHLVANSSILLNIKPWDDELDREAGERQLVPMGHDIGNLQIAYVAEDDRLGTDLPEEITTSEEQVQSVNFPALNKS
ncbi:Elongation factor 1-delta [Camelus dromedarius]|uniref:Elongation factor 1-delta n=1 Tax=Camelus dromedarius TaxID=9838 RepID=A0A5N4E815_CAMDR|nr:Elongation factor 1-delta [Camelus dromedarius]